MTTMHTADLVLHNARVWTVDDCLPQAQAVAIRGHEILAVGQDADMAPLAGPGTRTIDLAGQLVLPGFNDAHTHSIWASIRSASAFDLYGVTSLPQVHNILRAHAADHPEDQWLSGWRWDRSRFESGAWPKRADLDLVIRDRPVGIFDIDGHSCWVNTRALEVLGYTAGTPDPVGGQILRDDQGQPIGILLETAHEAIPRSSVVSSKAFIPLLRQEAANLNRLGITSLSNNGVRPEYFEAYARMAAEGTLPLRINEWFFLHDGLDEPLRWREQLLKDEKVRIVGLKALLDGVLSARTAWMLEPYADAPESVGFPVTPPEVLEQQVLEADAQGFQLIIHAIGDRAVREALNIYDKAAQTNGRRNSRHRVEHVELAHPRDQARFAELGAIACMTPLHCTACIDEYVKDRLGEPRAGYAYPWRGLVDRGVHLCFGTDWPAIDLPVPDPLKQIFAAVTRSTPQTFGQPVWHGEQRLSVAEAIRSYTLESAYAEFMEGRKGSITPGKLADLCVLTHDILSAPPEQILDTEVVMTVFDGELVYSKD
jgi:predicted amidohydrolase YtcJ